MVEGVAVVHGLVMVQGHYTYALTPVGEGVSLPGKVEQGGAR